MDQGTKILMDPDEIVWPDKIVTRPPSKAELRRMNKSGKSQAKTKHGVFGDLVHKYKNETVDAAQEKTEEILKLVPKHGRPRKASATKKAPAKRTAKKANASHPDSDEEADSSGKANISKILVDVKRFYLLVLYVLIILH